MQHGTCSVCLQTWTWNVCLQTWTLSGCLQTWTWNVCTQHGIWGMGSSFEISSTKNTSMRWMKGYERNERRSEALIKSTYIQKYISQSSKLAFRARDRNILGIIINNFCRKILNVKRVQEGNSLKLVLRFQIASLNLNNNSTHLKAANCFLML